MVTWILDFGLFSPRVITRASLVARYLYVKMSSDKEVAYAFMEFLSSRSDLNAAAVEEAIGAVSKVFEVDLESASDYSEYGLFPAGSKFEEIVAAGKDKMGMVDNLKKAIADAESGDNYASFVESVSKRGYFDGAEVGTIEYLRRQSRLVKKYQDKAQSGGSAAMAKKEKDEKTAEELKALGNSAMTAKDYDTAVKHYTDALDLTSNGPNSHVYYSNRAAAYCSLKQYQNAVDDCESAVALQPTYGKAVARLGLAHYFLGNYEKSVESYEMSVALEPDNKSSADALAKAKAKLNKVAAKTTGSGATNTTAPGGAGPDLASMMAGLGGGGGGMPPGGLEGLMNNPQMMSMAQEMMKNPAMMAKAQQMMQDPDAMQKAMSMMGGMK